YLSSCKLLIYNGIWRTERDERPPGGGRHARLCGDATKSEMRQRKTQVPVGRYPPHYGFTGSARLLVASEKTWRTERDSNPRRAFDPYTLSRGAPSTTRPSVRVGLKGQVN